MAMSSGLEVKRMFIDRKWKLLQPLCEQFSQRVGDAIFKRICGIRSTQRQEGKGGFITIRRYFISRHKKGRVLHCSLSWRDGMHLSARYVAPLQKCSATAGATKPRVIAFFPLMSHAQLFRVGCCFAIHHFVSNARFKDRFRILCHLFSIEPLSKLHCQFYRWLFVAYLFCPPLPRVTLN